MKRAAIYARISDDAAGEGLGVARQIKDCQHLVEKMGWLLDGDPYVDNDVSATRSPIRPAYQRLLADMEAGKVDAVVVWALDRLHRRPIELEEFIALVERKGIALANVSGDIDLRSDMGQLQARIMGAVAAQEAKAISRRVRRKQQELREAGLPFSGGIRCFGWGADRLTPIPGEQDEIRHMVEWVLAGRSLASLVHDLNERGVPTVSQWMAANPSKSRGAKGPVVGKPWTVTSVRSLLSKPRLAGLLTHKGEIVGKGAWEPVVDRATFDRVQQVLRNRSEANRKASSGRRYLLSGIAVCGTCGTPLQVGAVPEGKASLRRYRCPRSASGAARGTGERHGGRNMRHLDDHVMTIILMALDAQRLRDDDDPRPADPGPEIERLRGRLNTAADQFADDLITAEQMQRISTRLRAQIESLEASRPAVAADNLMEWYTGSQDMDEARLAFDALPLDLRRRIIVQTLGPEGQIVVHPAAAFNVGGVGGMDTSTVNVNMVWGTPAPTEIREAALAKLAEQAG